MTRSLDSGLQALFDAYAAQLPAKIKAIEDLWARAAAGDDREAVRSLHRELHSLAGSGETFGYSQLGRNAKTLELAMEASLDGPALKRGALEPLAPLFDMLRHAATMPDSPAGQTEQGSVGKASEV